MAYLLEDIAVTTKKKKRLDLQGNRVERRALMRQQDAVAQQRRMVSQGLFGGEPRQLRSVVRLRQVA